MPYTRLDEAVDEIDAAQRAVEQATIAHSRGGSVDKLNKANRRLAEANNCLYEYNAGIIPTNRR